MAKKLLHGRAPRGARGLKFLSSFWHSPALMSRPSRGAWIEMYPSPLDSRSLLVAPLAGRVD